MLCVNIDLMQTFVDTDRVMERDPRRRLCIPEIDRIERRAYILIAVERAAAGRGASIILDSHLRHLHGNMRRARHRFATFINRQYIRPLMHAFRIDLSLPTNRLFLQLLRRRQYRRQSHLSYRLRKLCRMSTTRQICRK
jgi:hypothetical protein